MIKPSRIKSFFVFVIIENLVFSLRWKVRILGDMLISFPAAILSLLVDPSPYVNPLEFRLQNLNRVENVIANPQLITQ